MTVTGVNDNNADGNKAYKIILSSSGQDNATLSMSNLDDDFPSTPQVTVNGLLSNSGTLLVQNSEFTLSGGASLTSGSFNVGGSTVVLSDNFTKTGGTVTANTATLKLNNSIILTSNNGLTFQDLDLNNSALTLGSATSDFTVSNAVTLDNTSENINVGTADLTLSGGLTLTKGNIGIGGSSSGSGSIVLGNTSTIAADGTLDLGGALVLNAGLSVAGTLKTDNTTTLTLNNNALNLSGGSAANGGLLEVQGALTLDGITFDNKTTIKLNDNTTLTSNAAFTVKTIDMGTHSLSTWICHNRSDNFR